MSQKTVTKTRIAADLGISRQSLYYKSKKQPKDELLKEQILQTLSVHKSYGYRRVALALGINKKRAQRLMHKFKIHPYKRRLRLKKRLDLQRASMPYGNLVKGWFPTKEGLVYASDFTYLPFRGRFIYLATIMDIYTREIVGWEVSQKHDTELVANALINGLFRSGFRLPTIIHSDQGSEYCSKGYIGLLRFLGIRISMSTKSSPWENGYQESYYSNFKTDLGLEFDRFNDIGELVEAIYQTIHYYNHERIHTSLKMPPSVFAKLHKSV